MNSKLTDEYNSYLTELVWAPLETQEELYQLTGQAREVFLQSYCSQEIKNAPEYLWVYGCFLTRKGKLVSDVWIMKTPDYDYLLFPRGYGEKVHAHLKIYLDFADLTLTALPSSHFLISSQDKNKLDTFLTSLLSNAFQQKIESSLLKQLNTCHPLRLHDESILFWSSQRWGMQAYEFCMTQNSFRDFIQKHYIEQITIISAELLDMFRIEAKIPRMGIDMNEENFPAELGLDKSAVSFSKGCYLGQEPTARIDSRGGIKKQLVQFELSPSYKGELPARLIQKEQDPQALTLQDGESQESSQKEMKVGHLTSLCFSQSTQKNIGLGIIQKKALEQGSHFTLDTNPSLQVKVI